MADITNTSRPPEEVVPRQPPSGSPRSSPVPNPSALPHQLSSRVPANAYPFGPPPPMGSPSHNPPAGMTPHPPSGYPLYPHYPPMNGPPHHNNYPPQNQGPNSPSQSSSGAPPPPHFNMYHHMHYHPNGMPPPHQYPGHPYPGYPGGFGWPPSHATEGAGSESPNEDGRDAGDAKVGDKTEGEGREPMGENAESTNKQENHHPMPSPGYYHAHFPPYGNPPPGYQNSESPAEAPPMHPHHPPGNYPGQQYGHPPPYGHPAHPYHYPSDMHPYPPPYPNHPSMHGAYPPYPGQESPSPWKEGDKKRQRASPSSKVPYEAYPPNKRSVPNPHSGAAWGTQPQRQFPASKSQRRKKKMYSDYVGVTYNKTHAKYQACITHYRKQHYLGRYKLAVDAALAYDESARLLKGASWKVNFSSKEAYEEAKKRELAAMGEQAQNAVDLDKAMSTVALKVEEIASKASNPDTHHFPSHPGSLMSMGPHAFNGAPTESSKRTPFPQLSHAAADSPSMTKVTPSPSGQAASPHHQKQPDTKDSKTPLPETPNPTRHAMGAESSTPDSVIRPTVLSYFGKAKEGQLVEVMAPPSSKPIDAQFKLSAKPAATPKKPRTRQSPKSASKLPSTPKVNISQREAFTSPRPIIQNNTLAAASALMTLSDHKKGPAKST